MSYLFHSRHVSRRKKVLVFVQSCKQAKYYCNLFHRLRAPTQISALYGTLSQLRRMAIYQDFCDKKSGVLIATDIAARGLGWIVAIDSFLFNRGRHTCAIVGLFVSQTFPLWIGCFKWTVQRIGKLTTTVWVEQPGTKLPDRHSSFSFRPKRKR